VNSKTEQIELYEEHNDLDPFRCLGVHIRGWHTVNYLLA
jgi:hypothetical protein